ncbi:hypothetical protein GPAL_1744 [Glaciecola pallidula DSM 14239 = ACAM 615]|uniref:Uncharacterized protein n=1 Tax=Brumicola pallidula DSM 14239 = ACAM 615 TaxID=1121922 RepID=K6ZE31_9ALTE|nr:hypothetical protein GPAL_1744 [Glaciecola pallidula DSM 14239 = ACAM 615]
MRNRVDNNIFEPNLSAHKSFDIKNHQWPEAPCTLQTKIG